MGVVYSNIYHYYTYIYHKRKKSTIHLVGGFNPFENYFFKMGIFPKVRGEKQTYLKPPPSRVGK